MLQAQLGYLVIKEWEISDFKSEMACYRKITAENHVKQASSKTQLD